MQKADVTLENLKPFPDITANLGRRSSLTSWHAWKASWVTCGLNDEDHGLADVRTCGAAALRAFRPVRQPRGQPHHRPARPEHGLRH